MEQRKRREALVLEGISGKTVRDTLPNTALPLVREAEAMYFGSARRFLKTSLAHTILFEHQDISKGEVFLRRK